MYLTDNSSRNYLCGLRLFGKCTEHIELGIHQESLPFLITYDKIFHNDDVYY